MYLFLFVSVVYFIACLFKIVNPRELVSKIDPLNTNEIENLKQRKTPEEFQEYKRFRSGSF